MLECLGIKYSGGTCWIFLQQDPNIPFKASKHLVNCWAFLSRLFTWSHLACCTSRARQPHCDLPSLCVESLQICCWCPQDHSEEHTDPTKEPGTLLRGSVQTQHLSYHHPKLWRRHWRQTLTVPDQADPSLPTAPDLPWSASLQLSPSASTEPTASV